MSSGRRGKMEVRGQWKPVSFDFLPGSDRKQLLEHLVCIEQLDDYEIVGGKIVPSVKQTSTENIITTSSDESKKKKKKKKPKKKKKKVKEESVNSNETKNDALSSSAEEQRSDAQNKGNKRKHCTDVSSSPVQDAKKPKLDHDEVSLSSPSKHLQDMHAWDGLYVPDAVMQCLRKLKYGSPTPIQALTLPSAIRDKLDIVGAAETGSGKTLAFAIPLIHHILEDKKREEARAAPGKLERQLAGTEGSSEDNSSCDEDVEPMDQDESSISDEPAGCDSSDDRSDGDDEEISLDQESYSDDDKDDDSDDDDVDGDDDDDESRMRALILLPTRELALQVRDHMQAVAAHTGIKCVAIVGGMSIQKQTRLLKKRPDVVIATPGRLWEMFNLGDPHLNTIPTIRYLVIDEADRMVEKGHFQELTNILNLLNADSEMKAKRQTFVFSATLTFVHSKPHWLDMKRKRKKKNAKQITTQDKLESLIERVGFRGKPKVVDLTVSAGTVSTLSEARINCAVEEKDLYLYYFLLQYPGRTLVFCNSKDCVRRLVSVFSLLRCNPFPLHSDMHQRQRLKNLDRFKDNSLSLLVATDVAARGLDIPGIQHVIHYQVPQTTENYVHRSGRTARAQKEGLSVMLIGPDDVKNYNKIMKSLKRDEDLPLFPVRVEFMAEVKQRMGLARQIDQQRHRLLKEKKNSDWFEQAAQEADIILDDEFTSKDNDDAYDKAAAKRKLTHLETQLNALLGRSLTSVRQSFKYPTKSGKLSMPYLNENAEGGAVQVVRNENAKKAIAKESLKSSDDKTKKKKKKKKFYKTGSATDVTVSQTAAEKTNSSDSKS